jgi:hypothetical protein
MLVELLRISQQRNTVLRGVCRLLVCTQRFLPCRQSIEVMFGVLAWVSLALAIPHLYVLSARVRPDKGTALTYQSRYLEICPLLLGFPRRALQAVRQIGHIQKGHQAFRGLALLRQTNVCLRPQSRLRPSKSHKKKFLHLHLHHSYHSELTWHHHRLMSSCSQSVLRPPSQALACS